jgi:apolipoprotein N-acyltransferase
MEAHVITHDAAVATMANSAPVPEPDSNKTAAPIRLKLVGLALLSGVMLWLCYFPVAWGWLGWFALVPLMPLLRAPVRGWWRYLCAMLAGTAFYWPAISWMTEADSRMVACWAMLSIYCSLYFPLAIFLVRCLDRGTRLPLLLTFPVVWTGLEFLRSFLATGFPWYYLAHTQHNALYVIQIADLGGAFAVSFLVAAVNVILYEILTRISPLSPLAGRGVGGEGRCCQAFALQLAAVAVLLAGTLAYGAWTLSHDDFETGPRIALLQGNLDQRLRIAAHHSPDAQATVRAAYMDLCIQAARLNPRPQLIVWPETSYPVVWVTIAPGIDLTKSNPKFRNDFDLEQETVHMVGTLAKTNVLLGLNTIVFDDVQDLTKIRRFNSALLIDAKGSDEQRYDKIHRVPFGEYVPLRDWLPFMNRFAPYDFDYSIRCGDGLTRFTLGKYHFGVLVCYEDTDPFMARDYGVATTDGPPVDFLLNMSNDGWFNGSSEHEEHLAISRFRAIETRRTLARSVNMGISAVIDSNGRLLAPVRPKAPGAGPVSVWEIPHGQGSHNDLAPDNWPEYKKTEGILVFDVPIDRRASLYAAWGDCLPFGCWILIGSGLAWSWRGRRERQGDSETARQGDTETRRQGEAGN